MATPVVATLSAISTAWEALTPPDRTTVTYHELDGRARRSGVAGDRGFVFSLPRRMEAAGHAGVAATQVWWLCSAELRLSQAGRTRATLADAVANESNLLMRSVEKTSSWPSNVNAVVTRGTEVDLDDGGDAIVVLEFDILTSETD
jgi:hypothetical protein